MIVEDSDDTGYGWYVNYELLTVMVYKCFVNEAILGWELSVEVK